MSKDQQDMKADLRVSRVGNNEELRIFFVLMLFAIHEGMSGNRRI